jgi:hypothetical protein
VKVKGNNRSKNKKEYAKNKKEAVEGAGAKRVLGDLEMVDEEGQKKQRRQKSRAHLRSMSSSMSQRMMIGSCYRDPDSRNFGTQA